MIVWLCNNINKCEGVKQKSEPLKQEFYHRRGEQTLGGRRKGQGQARGSLMRLRNEIGKGG